MVNRINQRAIIIGGSSGIGRELVKQLAASGALVAAVARRLPLLEELQHEYPEQVLPYEHDATEYRSIPALFQRITKDLGGLDLIVYCSGIMPEIGPLEFDFEKDHAILETNLLGAVAWLDQAATRFAGTRHGTIVGISSVAGERGRARFPAYSASKAALTTYLEALRNRLSMEDVTVTTIKPGPVQTTMLSEADAKRAMPAAQAAEKILKLAPRGGEHFLKLSHRIIFWGIRNTPSFIFKRLKL